MNILLIDPPTNSFTGLIKRGYPIGLCILAAVGKQENEHVMVYDVDKSIGLTDGLNFTKQKENMDLFLKGVNNTKHRAWKEIIIKLDEFSPDIVGISTMTIQYASALRVAEIVKGWNKECIVVMGGAHASVMPEIMIENPFIDIVVKGEGETPFRNIIRKINSGEKDFQCIDGVLVKGVDAKNVVFNEEYNLDQSPLPDRGAIIDVNNFTPEDMGLILSSRGCPYRCSYCSNFSKRTRFRSVDNVLREVRYVKKQYGTRQILFKDDAFTINKKRVYELCRKIGREKVTWECATRLDLIDNELIKAMKRSGCNRVGVGVESGDEEMLTIYNKKLDKTKIRNGVKILEENKMFWTAYFMMALPMEKEEQIMNTLAFMKELNPPYAAVGVYKPYPGTVLFNLAEELGIVDGNVTNEHFFKNNPVDYFIKNADKRCAYIEGERLNEIVLLMIKEFEAHNKNPKNMIKRGIARKKLYMRDLKNLVIDLKRAAKWILSN